MVFKENSDEIKKGQNNKLGYSLWSVFPIHVTDICVGADHQYAIGCNFDAAK
jgi:hypothetical protein